MAESAGSDPAFSDPWNLQGQTLRFVASHAPRAASTVREMAYRGGTGRWWSCAHAVFALAALVLAACASGPKWSGGRFVHGELGGSIADLAAIEPGWRTESAPDAALAYRHLDGSRASWLRDCRSVEANPKALGRALWIALPGARIEENAALEVAGAPAHRHEGRAQEGATALRVATIARVAARCEDYWLLVVPHAELHHHAAFEAWVQSFADVEPAK
jgi:hypothetical protein